MKSFSKEQALRMASFVVMMFAIAGVNLADHGLETKTISELIVNVALIIGMVTDAIGYFRRFNRGDVRLSGFRK